MGDLVADRADVVVAPLSFTHERRWAQLPVQAIMRSLKIKKDFLGVTRFQYVPSQSLHPLHASFLWGAFLLLCQRPGIKSIVAIQGKRDWCGAISKVRAGDVFYIR